MTMEDTEHDLIHQVIPASNVGNLTKHNMY